SSTTWRRPRAEAPPKRHGCCSGKGHRSLTPHNRNRCAALTAHEESGVGAMFDYTAVNWLAVVVAAIAALVIGTVWYLPAVFGNRWAALIGRDITARPSPTLYLIAIIGSLITAYVLALVIAVVMQARGPVSLVDGIFIGIVAWAGFQAASQAVGGAFE